MVSAFCNSFSIGSEAIYDNTQNSPEILSPQIALGDLDGDGDLAAVNANGLPNFDPLGIGICQMSSSRASTVRANKSKAECL
jgi:hypothetical protein